MPSSSHKFSTSQPSVKDVGFCIYCWKQPDNAERFSREHIIPFALGGGIILRNASCPKHSAITQKFEERLLSKEMAPFRQNFGMPSRRPPKVSFPLTIRRGSQLEEKLIPAHEHPSAIVLPIFKNIPGGYGRGEEGPVEIENFTYFGDSERFRKGMRAHTEGAYEVSFDSHDFIRFLAKIAHGYAVYEFGSGFLPTLIHLVEGNGLAEAGYWVGKCPDSVPPFEISTHSLRYRIFEARPGAQFIGVDVQLFAPVDDKGASFNFPTYSLVAGVLIEGDHSRFVTRKVA